MEAVAGSGLKAVRELNGMRSRVVTGRVAAASKVKDVFKRCDRTGSGTIARDKLARILLKLSFSAHDVEQLLGEFVCNTEGQMESEIDYNAFLEFIFYGDVAKQVHSAVQLNFQEGCTADSAQGLPVVLVHGFNNSSSTWTETLDELASHSVRTMAVDLRGHGQSPLGEPEDFGPRQLAVDVHMALCSVGLLKNGSKIVLVGHSMGGRIAMRYAAEFPEDLAALVIEDIDCVPAVVFLRSGSEELAESWRLKQNEASKKRLVQHLDFKTILCTDDGLQAWHQIAAARNSSRNDFPIYVFVSGPDGTVCHWDEIPGGVYDMEDVLPGVEVQEFPEAGHWIHSSPACKDDFAKRIVAISCGSTAEQLLSEAEKSLHENTAQPPVGSGLNAVRGMARIS